MHFVVSWDIEAEGEEWTEINAAMKEGLSGYSWVRPLTTFYIVKVGSLEDKESIYHKLIAVAKKYPREVNVVITPAMDGGTYSGWLPKDLWPKVRKRTE